MASVFANARVGRNGANVRGGSSWARAERTPDFQTKRGYPTAAPGKANLSMSTNQLANRFGCVAMTLEMPFKAHDDNPDPVHGWSPARCRALARECLLTLDEMIDDL